MALIHTLSNGPRLDCLGLWWHVEEVEVDDTTQRLVGPQVYHVLVAVKVLKILRLCKQ